MRPAATARRRSPRVVGKEEAIRDTITRVPRALDHPWILRSRATTRPLVFAHRGGAALAPENTIAAFDNAHALGVDGFELDVRLSRDGEVVVIHDAEVDRTTDGFARVSGLTADELRRLDAGFRFTSVDGSLWRGRGARIPLLRDVLACFPEAMLIIELKGNNPRLARAAFDIVREAGALDRVCFGGFQRGILSRLRRLGGAQVCSSASREETRWSLYRSWVRMPWPWRPYDAFQVPEISKKTRVVSPEFVRAAHARGLLVQVWTVNDARLLGNLGHLEGVVGPPRPWHPHPRSVERPARLLAAGARTHHRPVRVIGSNSSAAPADANQHVTLEAAEAHAIERPRLAHDLERPRRQRRTRAFQLDDQHFLGKSRQYVAQQRDARVALDG